MAVDRLAQTPNDDGSARIGTHGLGRPHGAAEALSWDLASHPHEVDYPKPRPKYPKNFGLKSQL